MIRLIILGLYKLKKFMYSFKLDGVNLRIYVLLLFFKFLSIFVYLFSKEDKYNCMISLGRKDQVFIFLLYILFIYFFMCKKYGSYWVDPTCKILG
jgi:hypothetical protein